MQKQEEIWKDIPGYEGLYQASSLGKIKSLKYNSGKKEKELIACDDGKGYLCLGLNKNKKRNTFKVHKLIAMTFLNHIPNGHKTVIDHINNNRKDNRVCNLQLITNRENASKDRNNYTSKNIGVFWSKKDSRWVSKIYIEGKAYYLGYFKDEIKASEKYQKVLKDWIDKKVKPIIREKTSTYKGVCWDKKRKKWASNIRINSKTKFLGYFDNEIDASNAYQNKLKELKQLN
jgi:hypothetical protein